MASYGIVSFVYTAALIGSIEILGFAKQNTAVLYLWVMAAMWILGAVDDIWGSREVGGFKGHFKKLIFERKLTTGAAKALGGGIVGVIAGWVISAGDPVKWILAAMLIPLAANLLNLFDLRPGRAVAVFFFCLGVTCIPMLDGLQAGWIISAIALTAFVWAVPDSRGKAMMGDSGSNSLGAALGVTMAINTGWIFQAAAIICILVVHWYSEKHSITKLIERNSVLKAIDSRLGVR
jgi:UDP-N-acetylmuramyl pentapeptide phosphotransferase/UDP-N-acetylglucosamine-1-phosphate transferase